MIKNYVKIAWRNIVKYKFTSFINLFGLTIGLTCCLLILAYIVNELSFDRFNYNTDRVYRVTRSFLNDEGNETLHLSAVAPPFGPLLKNDFSDIEKYTRFLNGGTSALHYEDKLFNENNVFFADENFFSFFNVPVVEGSSSKALAEPYSIMLTENMAKKYFGSEDPMNKMIKVDNQKPFKVTGIFKAFPSNSHFHPEIILSFNTLKDSTIYGEKQLQTNWGNNSFYTYLMFPKNYPVEKIAKQFPAFIDKHLHDMNDKSGFKPSKYTRLYLQNIKDIHLRSHLDDEMEPNGDIKRVYIFSIIALFVLLIACINYMNLSTARSAIRAKEIGIRKVVGAQKREIIIQFLSESIFITWIALILAVGLATMLLPAVGTLAARDLTINDLLHPFVLIPIALLPFIIGAISGVYPALFMSAFRPVRVLKGAIKAGKSDISFRQVLVVVQFCISIVLIVATLIVYRQLRYMQNASLGYNKEHIITIPYNNQLNTQFDAFRTELLQNPDIKEVGRSSRIPTGRLLDGLGVEVPSGKTLQPAAINLRYVRTDYNFIPTYGITMAAGRNFSKSFATDSNNYVINETAVNELGFKQPQEAIGRDIVYGGVRGKIIGIMHDFHFESMHQKILPILFALPNPNRGNGFNQLSIKVNGNEMPVTLSYLENTWKKYLPETPFQYTFLDERFNKLYAAEQQQGTIFIIFASMAIVIACLGLFGLSSFIILQRVKEIGIRKVLGANTSQLILMMSKEFLKLVLIAAVIAFPIAWMAMNKWLQDFSYRINISVWVFLLAGVLSLMIAFLTVSFQSLKAALANPVRSLRNE